MRISKLKSSQIFWPDHCKSAASGSVLYGMVVNIMGIKFSWISSSFLFMIIYNFYIHGVQV